MITNERTIPACFAMPQYGDALRLIESAIAAMPHELCPFDFTSKTCDMPACASPLDKCAHSKLIELCSDLASGGIREHYPKSGFDVQAIRRDFPILSETVHGKKLIWFDNAATTQKPACVIKRLASYYEHENSNVHRGAHALARRSTDAYEAARSKAAEFINAAEPREIIFVRGTTEGINLVAHAFAAGMLSQNDEILLSEIEHHANIVPWQMVANRTGAVIKVIPADESGQLDMSKLQQLLNHRTRLVAFTHVSNVLGTCTPATELTAMAHKYGAKVLIDGAQAVAHMAVDVQKLGCDFYAFSGHKLFGPMGIGVLYANSSVLEAMQPYQGGGSMITDVTFERSLYQAPPLKFEAGTGSIADAVALKTAMDYISCVGLDKISQYERELYEYGRDALRAIDGLKLIGTASAKTCIFTFILKDVSPEDVGRALDNEGIAVRTGHHCSLPILRKFGLESAVRASLAFYNTKQEIDAMCDVLKHLSKRAVFSLPL